MVHGEIQTVTLTVTYSDVNIWARLFKRRIALSTG